MKNTLSQEQLAQLGNLQHKVACFSSQLQRTLERGNGSPKLLESLDTCIDQWNSIINQAPRVLKDCKLSLLDSEVKR